MMGLNDFLVPEERLFLSMTTKKAVSAWYGLFIAALFWGIAILLPDFPLIRRFDPWMVAVTDRRVLVRRRLLSKHYNEISLSNIQRVEHDWKAGRLILAGPEHAPGIQAEGERHDEGYRGRCPPRPPGPSYSVDLLQLDLP